MMQRFTASCLSLKILSLNSLQQYRFRNKDMIQQDQYHDDQCRDKDDVRQLSLSIGDEVSGEWRCVYNHDAAQLLDVLRLQDDEGETHVVDQNE